MSERNDEISLIKHDGVHHGDGHQDDAICIDGGLNRYETWLFSLHAKLNQQSNFET